MNNRRLICLDAGHGGNDPGAVGNGMREADIVLEINNLLSAILKRAGHSVLRLDLIHTRTLSAQRPSINDRWRRANEAGADYFFSIHANAGGGTGSESFIFDGGDIIRRMASRDFAATILDTFCNEMGLRNRGVKPDTRTAVGSLGVLRNTRMPAQLFELPFIDGPAADINALRNRRAEMAQALANGFFNYLDIDAQKPEAAPIEIPTATPTPQAPPQADSFVRFNILGNIVLLNGDIRNGVTWVQARQALVEAGHVVTWDSTHSMVIVRNPGEDNNISLSGPVQLLPPRPQNTIRFDMFGRIVDVFGYIRDGVAWVQARSLFENAGYDVSWDCRERTITVEKRQTDAEEIIALREIVHWEARGEDERGQRLVANVILNRVRSPRHANTIKDVIFQSGINSAGNLVFQFTPAGRNTFGTAEHSKRTILAVNQALAGIDDSQGATFFHAINNSRGELILTPDIWHERATREGTLIHLFDHGNHRFYREAR